MKEFILNREEQRKLLEISRKSLKDFLMNNVGISSFEPAAHSPLREYCGAFVSLYIEGELRGCVGQITGEMPLYDLVHKMTLASATEDTRFKSIKKEELSNLSVEISVLSPLEKVEDIQEIIPGKHGIYIRKGFQSGTFLPQVADRHNWSVEEFLGNCAKHKAGLGWDGWKNAEIYTYEAIVIAENDIG